MGKTEKVKVGGFDIFGGLEATSPAPLMQHEWPARSGWKRQHARKSCPVKTFHRGNVEKKPLSGWWLGHPSEKYGVRQLG